MSQTKLKFLKIKNVNENKENLYFISVYVNIQFLAPDSFEKKTVTLIRCVFIFVADAKLMGEWVTMVSQLF